jgi:hypothetical protein
LLLYTYLSLNFIITTRTKPCHHSHCLVLHQLHLLLSKLMCHPLSDLKASDIFFSPIFILQHLNLVIANLAFTPLANKGGDFFRCLNQCYISTAFNWGCVLILLTSACSFTRCTNLQDALFSVFWYNKTTAGLLVAPHNASQPGATWSYVAPYIVLMMHATSLDIPTWLWIPMDHSFDYSN